MSEYSRRYWVGADGGELEAVPGRSANNHVSIACDYFRSRSEPVPSNDQRVYAAMFGRGFMRVIAEEEMGITDTLLVDNNGLPITPAQSQYLRALRGRHLNVRISVNNQAFESTQLRQAIPGRPTGEYMIRDRVGGEDGTRRAAMNRTMSDRERENTP